jgi:hypothetical protein
MTTDGEPSGVREIWDTDGLRADFEVLGFQAPFVAVRRKSDGQKGSLQFDHSPRIYYGWVPDTPRSEE